MIIAWTAINAFKILSIYLHPIIPNITNEAFKFLNIDSPSIDDIDEKLINNYDAVKFAKLGSEIIGGNGGGGRKDFAQAGGQDKSKIDEALEKIKSLV